MSSQEIMKAQLHPTDSSLIGGGLNPNVKFKTSEVALTQNSPKQWAVQKFKFFTTLRQIKTAEKTNVIALENIESSTGKFIETDSKYEGDGLAFERDDVLFGKLRPYLAKVFLTKNDGQAFGDILVFRAKCSIRASYLFYLILSNEFIKLVNSSTYGIKMPRANWDFIGNIKIPLPSITEQTKISNFLDSETAKIDELIQKQKKLIDLLEHKQHISILEVMSNGLNESVKYKKSSTIFWATRVPEHWGEYRLKFIFEIKKRIADSLGYDVLSITQRGIKVKDTDSNDGQLSMDYSKYQIVEPGDFAMNHMDLLTGYVDISTQLGVTSPDYRVFSIRNTSKYVPEFYLLLLQLCYKSKLFYPFGQGAAQLGRWRLPTDAFNNFVFPVPPKDEQIQICDLINKQSKKIVNLIQKAEASIALLKEHRASLISAAVTGKIDVRELV